MPVYLKISDARQLKHCIHGVRRFCTRYGLDFKKLLDGKMLIKEFENTGNAMALQIVDIAKARVKLKKKTARKK